METQIRNPKSEIRNKSQIRNPKRNERLDSPFLFAVAFLSVPGVLCGSTAFADWPLFRGNPEQTGVVTEALPDPLEVRWKVQVKRGIASTAAIVKGVVYVGSFDEHLYAFDLASGERKWKFKGGSFKAPPSFFEGAVYIGDEDGVFYCIDAAKGTKRWDVDIDATISGGANFAGDLVVFGSHDSTLHALHRADGKPAWKYKTKQGPVFGSALVADGQTFVAGCDSMLHIVDVKSGKGIAQVELSGQSGSTPTFKDGKLYVPNMANQVQAVDLAKRQVVWTFEAEQSQPFNCSAAVTDKRVIVGGDEGAVFAIDAAKGTQVWAFPTKKGRVESSPVVAGSRVYVGTTAGTLYVLDLNKGKEMQKLQLGKGITASPAVAEGCLVIGTTDGILYCLGKK
jgi:outer membrane protein assembly factor BamB